MTRLQKLHDAGVSIWLDTLSRELLDSGDFAALIGHAADPRRLADPDVPLTELSTVSQGGAS